MEHAPPRVRKGQSLTPKHRAGPVLASLCDSPTGFRHTEVKGCRSLRTRAKEEWARGGLGEGYSQSLNKPVGPAPAAPG